ncbi:EAL domain-containing protein [Rhodoferax sp.]|uniref:EAL domain-containing protein n=1 Tax=Rhodoferax sp. TaxID=50421 RepID=UPI0026233133|nr:EAL domain-containing protein [Rhodoferax sp.]MDD2919533.1 EAL domain-containing protein [Rhodoferax sp.]
MHYRARAISFALAFVAAGLHIHGKGYSPSVWIFLGLFFLVYPHVQYWRASRADKPVETEANNLLIDSVLLGMFAAALKFSIWLSFAAILANLINSVAAKGWRGAAQSVLALLVGALMWIGVYGFQLSPHTEWPATLICVAGVFGYVLNVVNVGFKRNLQLRDIKTRQRVVLEGVQSGVITMSERGIVESFNQSAQQMFGYCAAEVVGNNVKMLMPEPFRGEHDGYLANYGQTGIKKIIDHRNEVMGQRKDGSCFDIELRVYETQLNDRKLFIGTISDISAHKQAQADLRVAATAFESQEGMVITDANKRILRANRAFTQITGYTQNEAVGQTPSMLGSGRHDDAFYQTMWEIIHRDKYWQGEIWDRRKNGEVFPLWLAITAVLDENESVTNYVGSFSDITLHKQAQDRIELLAFSDPLTALPNRRLLMDRLHQALASSARRRRRGAVLLIDLDNFKTLNDTLGHDKGDLLLQQVAQRLVNCVREGDTVARLGGDEFVVMLEGLAENSEEAASQAKKGGEKILAALNQPYVLADFVNHSTPSIGVTLFGGHQNTIEELLKQADLAMYQSKAAGRNTLRFFDPAMQTVVTARAALEVELREAVTQQRFVLHYQPQVDGNGRPTGAEALVRWQHAERGMVSPAEFIPLAEDTGLILPLGSWVLETACAQLALWAARPQMAHLTIAVNVSARQIRHTDFVDQVMDALNHSGADPHLLKLELTETLLLDHVEEIIEKMNALKARGVSFSLDDFGTGYSSLAYLKRLPLFQLKIDQSFVRDILTDPNDAAICRTIIALAQSLGLAVIAEGVESEAQRDFLVGQGCHAYQGYLFSRPLPVVDFEEYVKPG